MVISICNPNKGDPNKAEIRESWFQACQCKIVSEILFQNTSREWWNMSIIQATWEAEVGGSMAKDSPVKN
jgi:hypothetical protein